MDSFWRAFLFWQRKTMVLQTGEIQFSVPGENGGDDSVWESDLIVLKLIAEKLQRQHQLDSRPNKTLIATPSFLSDLSEAFISEGCPRCTPAMARQIWVAVAQNFEAFDRQFRLELGKVKR